VLSDAVLQRIRRGAGKRTPNISHLLVHTAGVPGNADVSMASMRVYHTAPRPKGNGWSDVGYHFGVRKNGLVELGRPLERVPSSVQGWNSNHIAVVFSGNGDLSDFTLAQYESGILLFRELAAQFAVPWHNVIGHREAPSRGAPRTSKTCPGTEVDMDKFRARLVTG
jgi:N-acetylmuramoyl-L-alanine amidase